MKKITKEKQERFLQNGCLFTLLASKRWPAWTREWTGIIQLEVKKTKDEMHF